MITLLIGLKNNLEYSKYFYKTTRDLYPNLPLIFVSYGSSDGTHEWMQDLVFNDKFTKIHFSNENKTLSDTYNKAAELCETEYFAFAHNDMVLAPGFIEEISKYLAPNTTVTYTTIEPGVFEAHSRAGKYVFHLGNDIEAFDSKKFSYIVEEYKNNKKMPEITNGWAFFMAMNTKEYLDMGGMDNLFNPMFCEDDDLYLRLKLKKYNFIVANKALCYHFVSKTSRYSDEFKNKTFDIEVNSNSNFVRKWGFRNSQYNKRYKKIAVIFNCIDHAIINLEPWFDCIYVDSDLPEIAYSYVNEMQKNTKYNLLERVKFFIKNEFNEKDHEIVVYIDARQVTMDDINVIHNLNDIITETNDIGIFEVSNLKIVINKINEISN